jgi:ankyrin repeat protein
MRQNNEISNSFIKAQLGELYNESDDTIWHIIAKNGHVEIIRKKYFDLDEREINFKNKAGLTPFAIAIEENNCEMVKELIKCGAKNSKEDMLNFIATAIKNEHSEMYMFLIAIFKASDDLTDERNREKSSLYGSGIVNSFEEDKRRSTADVPSCKPSCAKKILVDTLVNYEEDSSKNGSGSRS